jgi:hypothetical protein
MIVEPFGCGVGSQELLYLLGGGVRRNGDFNRINLRPAQPHKLAVADFVGDVNFDEQYWLVSSISKKHIGPAHEIPLAGLRYEELPLALKI